MPAESNRVRVNDLKVRVNISVAICTYNGARYLEEQLGSIAAQSVLPSEIVICDDGSTDTTAEIVARFSKSAVFPVRFHRNQNNLGSTKNFEQAIGMCRGDFIALCDQDDIWFPEKLGSMESVLRAQPEVAGVFCNSLLIDDLGRVLPGNLWQRSQFSAKKQASFSKETAPYLLIDRDTVTGATLLFRSSLAKEVVPISPDWVHDGWIALILASISEIRPLPACLMSYRLHTQQQVGARVDHWYNHLSTQKDKAIAGHRTTARRFSAMIQALDRLSLHHSGIDAGIGKELRRRVLYLEGRAAALGRPRLTRLPAVLSLLPGYVRYRNGMLSLLRDLLHA